MWVTGLALAGGIAAQADPIDPALTGTTQYDGWDGLTGVNYPGYPFFPGSGPWPSPIGSNQPSSGDAALQKVAGNAFPSGASLYFGGFDSGPNVYGGTLEFTDTTPVAGLETVLFQAQIGESSGYDFHEGVFPELHYNGGSQALSADHVVVVDRFQNGTFVDPETQEELPVYVNTWVLQWDLTGLGAITDFTVEVAGVQHAQLYQAQLDQSDVLQTVPEPAQALLWISGLIGLIGLDRRRRK